MTTPYATIVEADAYFEERLYSNLWFNTIASEKEKALKQAARAIDRLRYVGVKHSVYVVALTGIADDADLQSAYADQEHEFPRNADTEVPNDIKIASFEIAFALLDGVDMEQELRSLSTVSQGYASVRNTYDRSQHTLEHFAAGIPSGLAWRYLKQYLADPGDVKISRV